MSNKPEQQPSVEELQAIIAKQAEELERLKKTKKTKPDTVYDLIDENLRVDDSSPDAHVWLELLVFCVEKIKQESVRPLNLERYAEFKIDLSEALRVLGYLKNNKIFGATKNKSKNKYVYKDFENLDANTYILYTLSDEEEVSAEPTLTEEDF